MRKTIDKKNFKTSKWSGGETTELYIFPEGKDFKERNFSFRISTATFNTTESDFSDFTGYKRIILPIKGSLSLSGEEIDEKSLSPYEIFKFDGDLKIHSENSLDLRDFNFIYSKDNRGDLFVLNEEKEILNSENSITVCFSMNDYSLKLSDEVINFKGHSLFITDEDEKITVISGFPVIICVFYKVK